MSNVSPIASNFNPFRRGLACAALALALTPVAAMAQANGAGRQRQGAGMAGLVGPAEMQKILDDMDLTPDEKTKVDGIMQKATSDLREARQGLQDAAPEERLQKMQDLTKMLADTKTKVEAELTPEQKSELAKKLAGLSVTRAETMVTGEKKAADALDITADQKKQVDNLFDDTTKTLDGYKTDADAVTDDAGGAKLATKVQGELRDLNQQLGDILSQEQAQQVRRAAMQGALRGAMGGGGGAGGNAAAGGRRRRAAASQPAGN